MPKAVCSLQELIRLYNVRKMTLETIGEQFGISRQAVHNRLKRAGVQLRPRSKRVSKIDGPLLYELYVGQKLSLAEIGKRVGLKSVTIRSLLVKHGLTTGPGWECQIKYPQIRKFAIGEYLELPRPMTRYKFYGNYYSMAKVAGIRVSIRSIGNETVRVTRVA